MKVAFDLRLGVQGDAFCANGAGYFAIDENLLPGDQARYFTLFADDDLGSLHVAFDLTVDLQNSAADDFQPLADDAEIVADDGFVRAIRGSCAMLNTAAVPGRCRSWMTRTHKNPR